ncbi:hypothetical protein [Pseudomonas asiatica]|uniref:hypothetical protein n=1 Tax=Pseudomonas asiatica TaxID=2219225 RepID=UPI003839DD6A
MQNSFIEVIISYRWTYQGCVCPIYVQVNALQLLQLKIRAMLMRTYEDLCEGIH